MKKIFLLIAATFLFCGQMTAQDIAMATPTDISAELNPAYNLQTNIFSTPSLDLAQTSNYQLGTSQYASPKGWGIALIITGGIDVLSGLGILAWSSLFNKVTSTAAQQGFETDPEFDQAANTVTKVFKIAGIAGTVLGAGLITGGILLVNKGSKTKGKSTVSRPVKRKHHRYSENFTIPEDVSDWTPTFNAGPAGGGLTLTF